MPETRYYLRMRGRVLGPFSVSQLQTLRERGQFSRIHEVSEDRKTWVSASSLPELFPANEESDVPRERPSRRPGEAGTFEVISQPAVEWFYASADGKQIGPVPQEKITEVFREGGITASTLVWKEGLSSWTPVKDTDLWANLKTTRSRIGGDRRPAATSDGMAAIQAFVMDPIGALPALCETLGPSGSLGLGVVFGIIFDLCLALGVFLTLSVGRGVFQPNLFGPAAALDPSAKMALLWKFALLAVLPLASLTGALTIIRVITSSRGCFGFDVLIAGSALLPVGLMLPIVFLIADRNPEVAGFLMLASSILVVLILNAGFTRVLGLSDRGVILAIPATLLFVVFLDREVWKWILPN